MKSSFLTILFQIALYIHKYLQNFEIHFTFNIDFE